MAKVSLLKTRMLKMLCVGGLMAMLPSCSAKAESTGKPHHTPHGFRNPHPHEEHGLGDLIAWRWDRLRGHMPEGPSEEREYRFPLAHNDPAWLRANRRETTVTWIGHATLLVQMGGLNLLTDPIFSERASPVQWAGPQRIVPPGLAPEDLPPIDLVLLSHNHYDSLDVASVRFLQNQRGPGQGPRFYVPLGVKAWFDEHGIRGVVELDWWDRDAYRGLEIHCVPAQHFSARTPFDRDETLWSGWIAAAPGFRFYFVGDSGYSPDFQEIGRRLGPMDFSAIPIGAYAPRWFMQPVHINPEEAVRIHGDVGSRLSLGIHWGTFPLTDEAMDEPPRRLAAALAAAGLGPESFIVLQHGETLRLAPQVTQEAGR